jgi:hypothetical protein
MTRIGEILLAHDWIDATSLARAIAEQRHTGKRLCSLLIAHALLDPDDAAQALGEQHDVAAIQQRHLENRDRSLVALLPNTLARAHFALPIGRNRDGAVIVCVRDPRPELHAALERAIGCTVILAVGPATQLEKLVDAAYEPVANEEFEVDLSTGPVGPVDAGSRAGELSDLGSMTLVGLDDAGVSKDPTQSPQLPTDRRTTIAPLSPTAFTIDAAITALHAATTRDAALDVTMRFARGRWTASLFLAIKDGAALGQRGHGKHLTPDVVHTVSISLGAPSIIKVASDRRRIAMEPPQHAGAIQVELLRLLGKPRKPMAAPISVAGRIACVLAVGDPVAVGGDSVHELERLAGALGEAYTRLLKPAS